MPGHLHLPLLMVEDSDEDFDVLRRFLLEASLESPIYRCVDGEDALDFLTNKGIYADSRIAPRPSIILVDLNLPGTDGREVIEQLKQDDTLKTIPVVVLSSSANPKDIEFCYKVGVNAYLVKPIGLQKFRHLAQVFVENWFEITILPDATRLI